MIPKAAVHINISLEWRKYQELTIRILTSGKMQDYNTSQNPVKVKHQVYKAAHLINF